MDNIAHKALSRGKYLSCIPKHTTQDGIQSSLSLPPGLQSLDSAQMSN